MYIRRMKRLLICLILLSATPLAVRAQQWSGIIDPSRAINWSNKGVSGGIPNITAQCVTSACAAVTTSGSASTLAQINAAIASAPNNTYVFLPAGVYSLGGALSITGRSNVVVRGAGPDQTFLVFTGSSACQVGGTDVCISDGSGFNPGSPQRTANWIAGYAKGATSITLDSVTNLAVNDILILDQCNDGLSGASCGAGTEADTGNVWVCSVSCSSEGDSNIRRSGRSQSQVVVVTNISGSGPFTVGITPGLYMPNWRASQTPGAWWNTASTVSFIGIENMSLDYTNSGGLSGISVSGVRDFWVKNIRSIDANRAAIWTYGATRGTIRDSYFFGTQNAQWQSYGLETDLTSDLLVENNIWQALAAPMPAGESVTGVVYGYNFAVNDFYVSGGNTAWMQSQNYHHSSGISYHLYEGNIGAGFTADNIHGSSNFSTSFRNRFIGWEVGKTQQTNAYHVYNGNRYFNVIGNIFGQPGYHTVYTSAPASTIDSAPNGDLSIYVLGFSGNEGLYDGAHPNDPLVASTLLRWGNYDTVSGAARFLSSEVPSTAPGYANAVPGNQSLPASFYLSIKPSWWGSMPWPAIGPDVTGGNMANLGGHVYLTPAANCYLNIMHGPADGTGGFLTFNANNCYGALAGSTPPAPPTNLTVVVH